MASQDLEFKILAKVVGANAIDDLKKSVKSVGDAAGGINTVTSALKGLVAAVAIKEVVGFAKGLIDSADNMRDLSQKTQVSVKDLSGFGVAAEQSGSNLDSLSGAFSKLNKQIVAAAGGNEKASQSFSELGIKVKDSNGIIKPTGDIVKELADKFANLKDGPEKAAAAIAIFGKSGADMIPFLNNGSAALSKFSGLISDDFANRADQFNDSLTVLKSKGLKELYGALEAGLPAFQQILNYFTGLNGTGNVLKVTVVLIAEVFRDLILVTNTALLPLRQIGDVLFYSVVQIGSNAIEMLNKLSLGLLFVGETALAVLRGQTSSIPDLYKKLGSDVNAIEKRGYQQRLENQEEFSKRFSDRNKNYAKLMTSSLFKDSLLFGKGTIADSLKRQKDDTEPEVLKPKNKAGTPKEDDLEKKLKRELDSAKALREAGLQQVELDKIQASSYLYSKSELDKLIETKKSDIEVTKATKGFTEEGADAYRKSADEVLSAKIALAEFREQQKESFSVGAQQGLKEYADSAKDVAAQMKSAFLNTFKGLEDGLVNFVKTGKLNFRSLANSIIDDMIRIAIRQSITGPLAGALGTALSGAGGGGVSAPVSNGSSFGIGTFSTSYSALGNVIGSNGPMSLKQYANGGIANSPHVAIFGEGRTPEAFVPLPDGRTIPVTMKGGAMSGGNTNNVVVSVNVEGGSSNVQSSKEDGKQLGYLISNVVKQVLIDQKRPGGLLAG